MNTLSIKSVLAVLSASALVSCSAGEKEVNKRQDKKAELTEFNKLLQDKNQNSGNANPAGGGGSDMGSGGLAELEIKLPELSLAADAALAKLKAADIRLINKLNATEFVLFGKDGKSWSYKPLAPAADQIKLIEAIVVNPPGSTLYSLPDNQFWFVSPERLSRHKAKDSAVTGDEKTVTVEQFQTGSFLGDKSKMKVLFAAADEIILQLDTHLVIVTILPAPTPAKVKQLPIDKLPVDLKGELTAGLSAKGYWFRSAAGIFFFAKDESSEVSHWSKSVVTVGSDSLVSFAAWPDEASASFSGQSLGLSANSIFSDVKP